MGKTVNMAKKAAMAEAKELNATSSERTIDAGRGAANGQGDEQLFDKKMSKEEKKAAAATAKLERAAKKMALDPDGMKKSASASSLRSNKSSGSLNSEKSSKKLTKSEKATADAAELDAELLAARVHAAVERSKRGAYRGALEAASFTLPNPGGGAPLLEDASFTLVRGRRYALIGRNGKGKSTLLRALAARRYGDIPANVSVYYVRQEVVLTEESKKQTPAECILAADIERSVLMKEAAFFEREGAELTAAEQKRHCEVLEQLEHIEADSAPRRAEELLVGLGFSEELRARPLEALSGGWRVRTMLAAAIFARPDLLLLDEPTNHLSIGAVMWLARELSTSEVWQERTVVIVSHDRFFLDEVCGDCLHISGTARRLTQTHGNYTTWAARRAEQRAVYEKEKLLRQLEIDKLKEFAGHGFKYGGSSSAINKMKMKEKQAEKLEASADEQADDLAALQEDMDLPLRLCAGGALPGFVIQVVDVAFGYHPQGKLLMRHVEVGVTSASRIVLLGENGNGKTTLVKLMLGELQPTEGFVRIHPQARVALVNQHHADQLDLTQTPLEYMMQRFKQQPEETAYDHLQKLRGHLAGCGVPGHNPDLQNVPASALSGGQRSRVALAEISFRRPHVLVLDEPTNNLDLESVAALAEAVKNFEGAVVCVSHDQYFVNEIANEAWVVQNCAVKKVESFDVYRKKQLSKLDNAAANDATNKKR